MKKTGILLILIIFTFGLFLTILFVFVREEQVASMEKKSKLDNLEHILGISLQGSPELNVYEYQPSTDLALYYLFIKVKTEDEVYKKAEKTLALLPNANVLPGGWKLPARLEIKWWDAPLSMQSAENVTSKMLSNGWIAIQYSDGYLYIVRKG